MFGFLFYLNFMIWHTALAQPGNGIYGGEIVLFTGISKVKVHFSLSGVSVTEALLKWLENGNFSN